MSGRDKDLHDRSAVDAILKSLTSRPNVASTLILSRKDGSIIKSTGFRDSTGTSLNPKDYDTSVNTKADSTTEDRPPGEESVDNTTDQERHPPAAENLARSIYEFVVVASKVGAATSSLTPSDIYTGQQPLSTNLPPQDKQETALDTQGTDSLVQLLRMRTKRQETIIFPDPNYICCVVQNIGRTSGTEDARS